MMRNLEIGDKGILEDAYKRKEKQRQEKEKVKKSK
jgi:hypothetical protein